MVRDERESIDAQEMVGGHVVRHLMARAKAAGFGSIRFVERQPWERAAEPLDSYQLSYDIVEARQGLLEAQLKRMIRSTE